jgi:phage terminase large subunit-like protein
LEDFDKYRALLIEFNRHRRDAFWTYNGLDFENKFVHKKQVEFHRSDAKVRFVFGGNRTGKSECGAVEALFWALNAHPFLKTAKNAVGWVVSLTSQVQRDTTQKKILRYLDKRLIVDIVMQSGSREFPERGIIDFILVKNKNGGISKIGFKSCDQGREKFQGVDLDFVWFDEEPPEAIYDECLMRTLDRNGSIWATMTPLKGRTFVYEKIFMREGVNENIKCFSMSWSDNPFLPPDAVAAMENELSADELETRKFGRFMEGTGIVFGEFSGENIIEPFKIENAESFAVSIDPGFANPTAVLWIIRDNENNIFVVGEAYIKNKSVAEIAELIKIKQKELNFPFNKNGEVDAIIDSAAKQRTFGAPTGVCEQFRENGISVDTNVNKDVLAGISRMKALFKNANGERKLFVFKNCVNLINELRGYFWGDDERPKKANDHCIDALRYYIMKPEIKRAQVKNALGNIKSKFLNNI